MRTIRIGLEVSKERSPQLSLFQPYNIYLLLIHICNRCPFSFKGIAMSPISLVLYETGRMFDYSADSIENAWRSTSK